MKLQQEIPLYYERLSILQFSEKARKGIILFSTTRRELRIQKESLVIPLIENHDLPQAQQEAKVHQEIPKIVNITAEQQLPPNKQTTGAEKLLKKKNHRLHGMLKVIYGLRQLAESYIYTPAISFLTSRIDRNPQLYENIIERQLNFATKTALTSEKSEKQQQEKTYNQALAYSFPLDHLPIPSGFTFETGAIPFPIQYSSAVSI